MPRDEEIRRMLESDAMPIMGVEGHPRGSFRLLLTPAGPLLQKQVGETWLFVHAEAYADVLLDMLGQMQNIGKSALDMTTKDGPIQVLLSGEYDPLR